MLLPVTTILVSLMGLLLFRLSLRVIELRRKNKVSLGDGGHEDLQRAIRGQANCAEYAPIAVLLVLVAEIQASGPIVLGVVAILAAGFLLGRILHGYAFAATAGNITLRVRGMQLTLMTIVLLAGFNLVMFVIRLLS